MKLLVKTKEKNTQFILMQIVILKLKILNENNIKPKKTMVIYDKKF